jgi:glycosyltransferase involved in cell wall biosynthesis
MLASYFSNVPIRLHTVAGLPLLEAVGIKRIILNFVEKLTYRLSTKVFPNSFGLKKIILENKFTTADKLKVIGNGSSNGIDTSYFNPKLFSFDKNKNLRNNLQIEKNDFVFIFVGRLVSDKGINELIEVFNKLSININNVKLLLVGPYEDDLDPLNENTKQYIDSNKKIISVGYQNDVRPYFAISNALVFPSYREGFPNVVMQSGAMCIPSIVSDINGCNEIIENHNNGIIVQKKNVEALYSAMNKIYSDKIFYKNMKLNCRALIKNKYERKLMFSLLKDEYANFLIKLLNNNK